MVSKVFLSGARRGTSCANFNLLPIGKFFIGFIKVFMKMSVQEVLKSEAAKEMRGNWPAGENNWKSRQLFCSTLADAIDKYGKKDIPPNFFETIEPLLNNMLDCAISERTTLAVQGCRAIGNLSKVLGKELHPLLDRLLPAMIRHCASTKTVNQKSASAVISNIIVHASYNGRLLWHVCQAFEDKYTGPKVYAPGWLKLILQEYHSALHPDRDFDTIIHAITLGLEDADNNVRVNSRAVFWEYNKVDPTGAETIINKLNNHAKTALINDPHNPDKKSAKPKAKKPADSGPTLAEIRRTKMERKAVVTERSHVTSAPTITSEDFAFGPPNMGDDMQSNVGITTASSKKSSRQPVHEEHHITNKSTSQPKHGHKKGLSHDSQVAHTTKKVTGPEMAAPKPKKTGSIDNLHASQNKKTSSTATDASNSRPLLSAPVRRRVVATPMNAPQSSSRPSSRTGVSQLPSTDLPLRSAVSLRELRTNTNEVTSSTDLAPAPPKASKKILRPEASTPVLIPNGKENANVYNSTKGKLPSDISPMKFPPIRNSSPPRANQVILKIPDDSLTVSERVARQNHDQYMRDHGSAFNINQLQDEEQTSHMRTAYPKLNHDGQVKDARRALEKALEYLSKDALDYLGFRKLRKLLDQFGRDLIIDQTLYDMLFTELLQRLGNFEELLTIPLHELENENHPRYIRSAVLTMINTLILEYPQEWSFAYQGPALASIMVARCFYSVNADPHEGAPYRHTMTIVNQINHNIVAIIQHCPNPLTVLDSVVQTLSAGEDFLLHYAPHDSETQKSWASFNPYSKVNRLRVEKNNYFHTFPKNLIDSVDPAPVPLKAPLLMETGLTIIQALFLKAVAENCKLGEEREDVLADLARHLLQNYSIIIRRNVMEYVQILYKNYSSEERFWTHFTQDSDRNIIHYYIERMR